MRRALQSAAAAVAVIAACTACSSGASPSPTPSGSSGSTGGAAISMAVIGDSLSRGYNACDAYEDCPSVSWQGGTDARVDSVASRVRARTGRAVDVQNVAKTGVTSEDLERQVGLVLAAAREPDLVTVQIGGNDVCTSTVDGMTPAATFATAVRSALQRIGSGAPDAVVLVSSLLTPDALLRAGRDDAKARALWEQLGSCRTVLDDARSTTSAVEARRAEVAARVQQDDAALRSACAAVERCVYDDGAVGALDLTTTDLSTVDYVHPSVAGLQTIAAAEWRVLAASPQAEPLLVAG